MNNEKEIKSLNEDLALVQYKKIKNEINKKVNFKGKLCLFSLFAVVITICFAAMAAFPSSIALCISECLILSIGMTIAGADLIKSGLYFKSKIEKYNSLLLKLDKTGSLDEFEIDNLDKVKVLNFDEFEIGNLDEAIFRKNMLFGIFKKRKHKIVVPKPFMEEDFYSEKMLQYLATKENKEESKYEQALNKQISNSNIKLYNSDDNVSDSKDDVIDRIMYEIDAYCLGLNLPPIEISNNEWQIYFDTLYDVLCQRNAVYDFYNVISRLCRITLSNSLINKYEYLSIKDFVDSIEYLDNKFSLFAISLTKSEITALKHMLNEKINSKKIIAFKLVRKK